MIKILERYIVRGVLAATGLATLIVIGVLSLLTMLAELKNIGEGDYGLGQAAYYVLLRMPNELYQFSPMLILLGSIIGLSVLSLHRELTVMRAYGFSVRQIIYSVFSAAILLIVAFSFMGEWLGPDLSYKAEIQKENAQNAGQAVVTASGVWFHVANNFIHAQQVIDRQQLENVTRYQFDDAHHLLAAYYAKKLSLQHNNWQMSDVVKTTFYKDRTKSQSFAEMPFDLKFNTNLLNISLVEPDEMSLPKLSKLAHYLQTNGQQAAEYQFNFWKRIFQPLASLIMIFLAIPFVLGTLNATTLSWRILVGILVGFAFFILNAILGQLSVVYQLPAPLAALLPLILFACIAVILAKRVIRY